MASQPPMRHLWQMDDALGYLNALAHHWKVLLTGGTLIALVAGFGYATGNQVTKPWGLAILVTTLFAASFVAWREERTKRVLRVEIKSLTVPWRRPPTDPRSDIVLAVRLTNASREPRGVAPEWMLEVLNAATERVAAMPGLLHGEIRPLAPEELFNVEIRFPIDERAGELGARFVLIGADIHGHPLRAEFPTGALTSPPNPGIEVRP